MGISSLPEVFSREMAGILEGLEGVKNLMDDIIVFGCDKSQHDERLKKCLERLQENGATLNFDKCIICVEKVTFLGVVLDQNGIHMDERKVEAVKKFPAPTSVTEIRRFLGMANQLAQFLPNMSEISAPIRMLLVKNTPWIWDKPQEESFKKIKDLLTSAKVLAHYDRDLQTRVEADASAYGIGCVMQQLHTQTWRPVAYASRALTETERRYATIEKETVSVVYACERFSQYLIGKTFRVYTS